MPYTFFDASIATSLQALDSLEAILKKAQGAPNAASLPEARIHPDMLDLNFQVYFSCDLVAKVHARTAGIEPPTLEKDLKSFDDYFARIDKVRAIVTKHDKDLVNSRVNEIVSVGMGPNRTIPMPVGAYVACYALPNLYFHVTTAYDILRKNDVELGKLDFLAPFMADYMHHLKQ